MPQSYEIPLGIDAKEILASLDAIDSKIVELSKDADLTQKSMKGMFDGAITSDELLIKKLNETSSVATQLGSDFKKMLDKGLDPSEIQKRFAVITKALENVTKGGKIALSIDSGKLIALEALLESTKSEAEQLGHVLEFAKEVLENLDPNSEEFKALGDAVIFTGAALEAFNEEMQTAEKSNQSLGQSVVDLNSDFIDVEKTISDLEEQLYSLAINGKQGTREFEELTAETVRMKNALISVDRNVDAFVQKGRKLQLVIEGASLLAAGFTAVQSASALFGEENQELTEAINKTAAAMGILQAVQAIGQSLSSESVIGSYLLTRAQAAQTATTVAATGATVAGTGANVGMIASLRALYATLIANPIGLFVAAIAAAAAAVYSFALQNKAAKKELDSLFSSAENNKFLTDAAVNDLGRFTELQRAVAERRGEGFENIVKIDDYYNKRLLEIRQKAVIDAQAIEDKVKSNTEATEEEKKAQRESTIQAESDFAEARKEVALKQLENDTKRDEIAAARREKLLAEERKAYDERKKLNDLILQLQREITDIEIGRIEDDFQRQRAEIENSKKVRLDDLDAQRKDAIKALNDRIAEAKKNETYSKKFIDEELKLLNLADAERKKLLEAIKKEADDRTRKVNEEEQEMIAQLRANAIQLLAEYYEESGEREARLLKLNFDARRAEINKAYEKDEETRLKLLEALKSKELEANLKLKLDSDTNRIKVEEETQKLIIDILELGSSRSVKIEKEAAAERLKIRLEAIDKELAALELAGVKENDTRVLQLQKTKLELQKGLKEQGQEPASIFTLLGLDDNFSGEEQTQITDGLSAFYQNLQNISSEINAMYQRRIDKHKEVISEYEKDIDDLDGLIEKENEAKLRGDANNLAALEAERAAIEAARQKELEEVEKYQKKQQALQRVQLIADTAIGTSNLIVASTNVFKSLSPIPFVGVPLAIGLIATMFGSFAAAKINAFKELQDIPKFRKGGLLEGASHENGGAKFYSKDGNGFELEGKEYITNAESTRLNMPLLELINRDGRNPILREIQEILENGEGFKSSRGLITEGAKIIKMNEGINNDKTIIIKDNATLENKIDTLIELKRADVQAYEDNEYFYIKKGKELTKVKKEKRA